MQELIIYEEGTPVIAPETADKIAEMQEAYKRLEDGLKEIKARLFQEMKEKDILKIETPGLVVSYVAETTTEKIDTKALKKDLPEIYNTYTQEATRAGFVKLTVREKHGDLDD